MHSYARIFINKYDFQMTYVHKNLYKDDLTQDVFNNDKISLLDEKPIRHIDYKINIEPIQENDSHSFGSR